MLLGHVCSGLFVGIMFDDCRIRGPYYCQDLSCNVIDLCILLQCVVSNVDSR